MHHVGSEGGDETGRAGRRQEAEPLALVPGPRHGAAEVHGEIADGRARPPGRPVPPTRRARRDDGDRVPASRQAAREVPGDGRHAADHGLVLVGHDQDAQLPFPRAGVQRRFPRAWPTTVPDPALITMPSMFIANDASVEVVTVVAIAQEGS